MIWKSLINDPPTLEETGSIGPFKMIDYSKECLVTDGEDVWVEEIIFDPEFSVEEMFSENVTHYCALEDIHLPTID